MKKEIKNLEIERVLKKYSDDTRRHFDVAIEGIDDKVGIIAEQYEDIKKTLGSHTEILNSHTETLNSHTETLNSHTETLNSHTEILNSHTETLNSHTETLNSHTEMIGAMKEDVEIIKGDIEFIKGAFKKKVDYDEFAALERRLTLVESKIRR